MSSLLESILKLRCPKCRKGSLFKKPGYFVYQDMREMHENCPNCGLTYEVEPGFWIGALWVTYPLFLLVLTPFLILSYSQVGPTPWVWIIVMGVVFFFFYPALIRLGRSIWIHIWIKHKKEGGKSDLR